MRKMRKSAAVALTAAMAVTTVTFPSVLFLAYFSSREAALSKSRAHKRTRIDKDLEKYENGGVRSSLIAGEGRLGVVGSSRPPQKPKFQT